MRLTLQSMALCIALGVAGQAATLGLALAAGGALLPRLESSGKPVVTKQPSTCAKAVVGPDTPESIRKLMGPHIAYTTCVYDLRWTANSRLRYQRPRGREVEVSIEVTRMDATLSLATTIYLPEKPSQKLRDHEDGHMWIGQRVYETAERHAERLAKAKLGRTFKASGATVALARTAALNKAGDELVNEYWAVMRDEAQPVHDIYDELTEHGANLQLSEDEAIRIAFERREKEKRKTGKK